jgi:hypothetical protein
MFACATLCSKLVSRLSQRYKHDAPIRLSGLLRIARKYEVNNIAQSVVDYIKEMWSQSSSEWIKRESILAIMKGDDTIAAERAHATPEPASAIKFAMEFDVPEILRPALFTLVLSDPNREWTIRDVCDAFLGNKSEDLHPAARWNLLDSTMWRKLYRGRHCIIQHLLNLDNLVEWFCSRSGDYEGMFGRRCPCSYARDIVRTQVRSSTSHSLPLSLRDCMQFLQDVDKKFRQQPSLCDPCRSEIDSGRGGACAKFWEQLNTFLDLQA